MHTRLKTSVAALALSLAGGSALADINVGVVFSLTGPAASLGAETKKAVELMPQTLGAEKINYIILDDATDPTNAVKNARKLIGENKVDVILGPNLITSGTAMADVANEEKTVLLSMAPIEVAADKQKWAFRVEPTAEIMVGRAVADMKEKGIKTVGFVGFNDSWGELLLKALTKTTDAAGIKIVATERRHLRYRPGAQGGGCQAGCGVCRRLRHAGGAPPVHAARARLQGPDLPVPRRGQPGFPARWRQGCRR